MFDRTTALPVGRIMLTAHDLGRMLAADLIVLRQMLTDLDAMFDRVVPGPERAALLRNNAKLRSLVVALPAAIASHGPFRDSAHIRRSTQAEVRQFQIALTAAQVFLKAICTA